MVSAPRIKLPGLSAEGHGHLLAATHDSDAPQPALLFGRAFEISCLGDLLIVDREHDVAALEAEALCDRASGYVEHDHAFVRGIDPQVVCQAARGSKPWRPGTGSVP